MKHYFNFVVKCLGGATLLATAGCDSVAAPDAADFLSVSPPSVELGRVAQGAKHEVTLRLVNRSKEPIHIAKVATSCGCTTSQIGSKTLKPGQGSNLKVSYNSLGFLGQQEKFVIINFSDGQEALRIPVRANIFQLLKVSPPRR